MSAQISRHSLSKSVHKPATSWSTFLSLSSLSLPSLLYSFLSGLNTSFEAEGNPGQQGAGEGAVKVANEVFLVSIHNTRLSASKLITVSTEVADLINDRPLGKIPSEDSFITNLTPNCLLLGYNTAQNPGRFDKSGASLLTKPQHIEQVTSHYWQRWTELYAPTPIFQKK